MENNLYFLFTQLNVLFNDLTNVIDIHRSFTNLDAGQPEVVQRGSPWYEKNVLVLLCRAIAKPKSRVGNR